MKQEAEYLGSVRKTEFLAWDFFKAQGCRNFDAKILLPTTKNLVFGQNSTNQSARKLAA